MGRWADRGDKKWTAQPRELLPHPGGLSQPYNFARAFFCVLPCEQKPTTHDQMIALRRCDLHFQSCVLYAGEAFEHLLPGQVMARECIRSRKAAFREPWQDSQRITKYTGNWSQLRSGRKTKHAPAQLLKAVRHHHGPPLTPENILPRAAQVTARAQQISEPPQRRPPTFAVNADSENAVRALSSLLRGALAWHTQTLASAPHAPAPVFSRPVGAGMAPPQTQGRAVATPPTLPALPVGGPIRTR